MQSTKDALLTELALAQEEGKAEIINGEVVKISPTGFLPGYAGDEIAASLRAYAKQSQSGYAIGDNKGFLVDLPNRKSFSPDASFYTGNPTGMKFLEGAPIFAVEVRSENDYGHAAEEAMSAKRADYFAAGTLVVWDVDLLSQDVVRSYLSDSPDAPIIFRRGDNAHAESAVPWWTIPVDDLFPRYFD